VATRKKRIALGWREWIALPEFDIPHMKVKVDTGAATSSMHAFNLRAFERDGESWVRFEIHPWQRSRLDAVKVETLVVDERKVRPSTGRAQLRPVIVTDVTLGGVTMPLEFTLTRRDAMGFRALIGRQALRRVFVVDPSRSYLGGKPSMRVQRRNDTDRGRR
jgi:hypothetical protein